MQAQPNGMKAMEIIRLTMPEFDSISDDKLEKWINLVRPLVSDVKFKSQYEHAVALVVGHKLKLSGYGNKLAGTNLTIASVDGVASVSEGETSVSVDTSSGALIASNPADAEYAKTIYGIQFISLRHQMVMSIAIDGSGVRTWQK